jgi:hypothetical protein
MEILKPVTQGPPLAAAIELALRRAVQVTRIDPGAQTRRAGNETRQHPGQDRAAAEARDVAALRREMERRALPPGPPPTFKLSLLEMDRDLQRTIARNEARRAQASAAQTLVPDHPQPEAPVEAPVDADAAPEVQPGPVRPE